MPATLNEQLYCVKVWCPTKKCTENHLVYHSRLIEARHNGGLVVYQNVRCPIIKIEKQGELW